MDTENIAVGADEKSCNLTTEEVNLLEAFISGSGPKQIMSAYDIRAIVKALYSIYKDASAPKTTEKRIRAAEMCLIANGIETGEADTVLQAIGYILLDRELYPEKSKKDLAVNGKEPKFIIGGRQNGKTILLIREASKTNGIIVCPTSKMAEHVFRTSRELGCDIPEPITYAALLMHPNWVNRKALYFDEYGMTLASILSRQLKKFERYNTKSIIIDKESIDFVNDILEGLNVRDVSGRELQFKIEILGRNETRDQD